MSKKSSSSSSSSSNKNKFDNIQFQKSNIVFENEDTKLITGYLEGSFSETEIREYVQELSYDMYDAQRIGLIGVAIHYAYPSDWVPCIYSDYGSPVQLWDTSSYENTSDYEDIDGIMIYMIEKFDPNKKPTYHKPKKHNSNTSLFAQHKKTKK